MTATERTIRIATLNNVFRQTFIGGKVMLTQGVDALPPETKARVLIAVQDFKDFDKDNDPHHEHDFGAFEIDSEKYFFKIDPYDKNIEYGSPDPTDPSVTTRVLTIMRSDEY